MPGSCLPLPKDRCPVPRLGPAVDDRFLGHPLPHGYLHLGTQLASFQLQYTHPLPCWSSHLLREPQLQPTSSQSLKRRGFAQSHALALSPQLSLPCDRRSGYPGPPLRKVPTSTVQEPAPREAEGWQPPPRRPLPTLRRKAAYRPRASPVDREPPVRLCEAPVKSPLEERQR